MLNLLEALEALNHDVFKLLDNSGKLKPGSVKRALLISLALCVPGALGIWLLARTTLDGSGHDNFLIGLGLFGLILPLAAWGILLLQLAFIGVVAIINRIFVAVGNSPEKDSHGDHDR